MMSVTYSSTSPVPCVFCGKQMRGWVDPSRCCSIPCLLGHQRIATAWLCLSRLGLYMYAEAVAVDWADGSEPWGELRHEIIGSLVTEGHLHLRYPGDHP